MGGIEAVEARQRLSKWLEEGQSLFSQLEGVIDESGRLRARAEASEQECEKLRHEITEIQRERDDLLADLSKVMTEILHPMNQIVQKIRGKPGKSPFQREPNA
ncbi:MAG: hypothetical protein HY725_22970 [Candidatus Rokubacteria bacterium]|nr:hypothetical protein [Candidatus Rokubacteria bacterium]